jgi:hypothetical protein
MDSGGGEDSARPEFWFNLKTLKVEVGLKSAAPYRVGPFRTREEAAKALELLRTRSESWRDEEERD